MTPEQATLLSQGLPTGWLALARHMLDQRGVHVDPSFISKVKNGKKQHAEVEEVLLEIAIQERDRCRALNARIQDAIAR